MWKRDLVKATSKVVALSRSGRLALAKQLFDEMTERDLVLWNAMISGYSNLGCCMEAINLLLRMRVSGIQPDEFTFTATLSVAANAAEFWQGTKLHGLVICFGYRSHLPISNSLLDMYGKCLRPASVTRLFDEMSNRNVISWCSLLVAYTKSDCWDLAHQVFDQMPDRNLVAWNVMIAGYSKRGEVEASLCIFKKMQLAEVEGDCWTFSSLVNACSNSPDSYCGKMLHAYVIKTGRSSPTEVSNSVLSFYSEFGCHEDAVKIFESIEFPTQVSWNAIINAYMKVGDVCKALSLFTHASERNSISWTAMISGFARNGHGELALSFLVEMLRSHVRPDDFTFGAVLFACSTLALLGHGRMIHGGVVRCGFLSYAYVANGLINMYAKCGDLEASKRAFDENLRSRDLVSWNGMIMGFAQHGKAGDALCLFEDMLSSGVKPDKVTFLGLLMACSHAGLVEKGRSLLEMMERDHGVVCEEDQVACMVDMLGRNGQFSEARQLVSDHALKTGQTAGISKETLLEAAYSMHMDHTLLGEEIISKDLFSRMKPRNEMDYVLLSNFYCSTGQWKEAELVRMDMAGRGVKKKPGCSWIEVVNTVVVFVAGDLSHAWTADVHKMLTLLEREMRNPSSSHFHTFA